MRPRILPLLAVLLVCIVNPDPSLSQAPKTQPLNSILGQRKPTDRNREIYYKNKLEVSEETGWLPINIPFVFDCFLGDEYTMTPLKYTLVPNLVSLRWQMDDIGGRGILRGNWEFMLTGDFTAIPRGPETRYFAYDMGMRRNFIHRNWRFVPYFDGHLGMGNVDAKGPLGVPFAQGQDLTFTMMMGSGVRYNFNSRFAVSVGLNYMHISNLYLSEPEVLNYGINVYGPMIGFYMRLGKPKGKSTQQR